MFALDDALAGWDAALPEVQGSERLKLLLTLAWHLRQRDPARAQQLSSELVPLLSLLAPDAVMVQRARLHLVAAEPAWLRGELDSAHYHAEQALLLCEQAADTLPASAAACRADACWIMAWVCNDRGLSADGDTWLREAAAAARVAADPVRIDIIDAATGICDAFGDGRAAQQRWNGRQQRPGAAGADRRRLGQRFLRHLRVSAQRIRARHRPPDAEL